MSDPTPTPTRDGIITANDGRGEMCDQCGGQGWYFDGPTDSPEQRQCGACYGTGWVKEHEDDESHSPDERKDTPAST